MMNQNPAIIPLKSGDVTFQDIIQLDDVQLKKINKPRPRASNLSSSTI
ncbi:hypothetical protein J23TS9_19760 [Paenibacillus sp. J23TS9]|nr:hypothetical protein J23TS9_19760 [Paenibacillus sp. J23TS9]